MIKSKEEYDNELAAITDIVSGNHTHDVYGSRIVAPNYYQIKHAEKEKLQRLQRIYMAIAVSGIPWEDVVKYVESDPPTTGDQIQRHRHVAAKKRKAQEGTRKLQEARRRGKQTETEQQ